MVSRNTEQFLSFVFSPEEDGFNVELERNVHDPSSLDWVMALVGGVDAEDPRHFPHHIRKITVTFRVVWLY